MSTEAARNFPLNPQTDFIMYLFCSVWHYWIDVAAGISTKSSLDFFSEFTPVWLKPDKEFISPEESEKITRLLNRGEVVVRPVSRKQEHLTVNALSAAVSFVYVPANLQGLHKIKICIFFFAPDITNVCLLYENAHIQCLWVIEVILFDWLL